jgi:hypothetical protein
MAEPGRRRSRPRMDELEAAALNFELWQQEVLVLLRRDFGGELQHITVDEVDWPLWKEFYTQGRTPRAAIERALERDL